MSRKNNNLDDYSDKELEPKERQKFRRMVESQERAEWFWTISRTGALYITSVIVAITTAYTLFKDAIKAIVK